MKITFIMPSIGRKKDDPKYMKTWQMEPLPIGVLSSLTPEKHEKVFFDDRMDKIDYDYPTDLVAITVETYTARRSYEIAYQYKQRGVKVVMGGFHPTLVPDEVKEYCDAIVIGEAENIWAKLLEDFEKGELKKEYKSSERPSLKGVFPDRTIFAGKEYLKLGLVETGRGCGFECEFCSIQNFYNSSYQYRPIEDVIQEIKSVSFKFYFFVDDNIIADPTHAKRLFKALIPLKIKWFSQGSINMAKDPEMLELMVKSGCVGVLIGFESMDEETLNKMKKDVNIIHDRDKAVKTITDSGLRIYATFVFGYDNDTEEVFKRTFKYALAS